MSAAVVLNREITRRLRGECRVSVRSGHGMSLTGEGMTGFSCIGCSAPCELLGDGGVQAGLSFQLQARPEGQYLSWQCPECGTTVTEQSTFLLAHVDAGAITKDPLCVKCRANHSS